MIIGADFYSLTRSPADPRRRSIGNERSDLGILGSCGPRALQIHEFKKSSDSLNPAGFSNSRTFRYSVYFSFLFFPFWTVGSQNPRIFGYQVLESRKFFGPVRGSSDPTSMAKGKWLLNQESLTDRAGRRSDRGPSNSLRFREAAARFGSLISFRI